MNESAGNGCAGFWTLFDDPGSGYLNPVTRECNLGPSFSSASLIVTPYPLTHYDPFSPSPTEEFGS